VALEKYPRVARLRPRLWPVSGPRYSRFSRVEAAAPGVGRPVTRCTIPGTFYAGNYCFCLDRARQPGPGHREPPPSSAPRVSLSQRQTPAGNRPCTGGNGNPLAGGVSPHSPRGPVGRRPRPGKPAPSRARAEPPHAPPAPARPRWVPGTPGSVWRTAQLPPLAAPGALPARADRYHDATAKNRTVPAPARGQYGGYPLAPGEGVSVVAGAGPIAGRGLPPGHGGPGLAGRWRFPVPWPGCRARSGQKQ